MLVQITITKLEQLKGKKEKFEITFQALIVYTWIATFC
jgi:hypothetical protein